MPVIQSNYRPPALFNNGHLLTIYPYLFRRVKGVKYFRERLITFDGDILDVDWSRVGSPHLVILSHGLEGSSQQPYITGMVNALNHIGTDTLSLNFRTCNGELNLLPRFYHSGDSNDLRMVIEHALKLERYKRIDLVGFSLGGNITLKYLGEEGENLSPIIGRSVAFSVPCSLSDCANALARPSNFMYMSNFLFTMRQKLKAKLEIMELKNINFEKAMSAKNFLEWDNAVTAPLHGFKDAFDYYQQASCYQWLEFIKSPTLLVNAEDDPFLDGRAYPYEVASANPQLFLEVPKSGGHVGFMPEKNSPHYWSEWRALEFLRGDM